MLREPPGFSRSPLVEDPRVRFFVITSNLGENVVKSVEHNVWATQRKNEDALTDAFLHSKAVILIFSVNKSGAFQGYARMRGLPGRSKCRSNPFGGYGRMFDVEWLRLQDVVMPEVSYIRNSLDGGREVGYARDGQELPAAVGAELCRHFDVRVYLEDPKTYEPCVDDPQPVLPPPVRGADSTPRPGPPPAIPPPHQPAHELPYHWPAPSYGYPGPAPAGHPPPPQGYPPPTSPFSVAPSGLPPPWAVPPGAWLGHSSRHSRRRRRHRRRSSSYSQSPGRSSKRQRGSDPKEEALPDFTKMTHEEYVEWWKKTHPTAPANAAAASPPPEGVVEPSPPAPQASAPVPVSPFQAAAAPAIQDPAMADPVQAAAEAVPAPATCFERSDPPVSVAAAAPAEPAKPPKEKKKKKKEAEAAAKAAAAPPTAASGAAPVEAKPVKEKKAKKDKKEKKQKKNKEKTVVLNGDAEISGKDVVAPGEVSPQSSAGAPEAVVIAEMPKPIQANGKEISAAVAAVPQSMNSSVAAAARESVSPSPKGKDVAAAAQSPPMTTSGGATAPVAAPKSILRNSQASSTPSASEPAAPTAVAPASASAPPQPKSILRRPQATEVAAAVQKSQEAVRQPGLDADPRLVGAVTAPAADKSKEIDDDDDSESTMSFESDIEIEANTGDAMLIDDGYGSASD